MPSHTAWLTKFLEKNQRAGKNPERIPLMIVNKTKNDMKNTEKKQLVETIYAKNMDRTFVALKEQARLLADRF